MSSIQHNKQSMNGVMSIDDGAGGLLEGGVLSSESIITGDIKANLIDTLNCQIQDVMTCGDSVAIGNNLSISNNIVCSNNLFIKNIHCQSLENDTSIKTKKIELSYSEIPLFAIHDLGYIKASISRNVPLLATNQINKIHTLELDVGVYIISYSFDLTLSSAYPLVSLNHGIASNGTTLVSNILKRKHYGSIIFNNIITHPSFNETCFYRVETPFSSVYMVASHHTLTNVVSPVVLNNCIIKALRVA